LFLSTAATAAPGTLNALPQYAGLLPLSLVFDPHTQARFFVADSVYLWSTQNGTAAPGAVTFQNLTPNLPAGFIRPNAVEFISNNGVDALLVGGLSSVPNAQSPVTVADSDASGNLVNWRLFGTGLPNAPVTMLAYNPTVDALAVATFGRGAWLLYDVTSNFPQATVLQFGLADNNSNPSASILTDGTALDGSHFVRPLIKYGTGTLIIAGAATYTGEPSSKTECWRLAPAARAAVSSGMWRSAPTQTIYRATRAPTSSSCSIGPTATASMGPSRARARWCRPAAGRRS
jgi:hypothetical protein